MLLQIPVYAVMVEDLGERGAHFMAYKEFCKEMHVPPPVAHQTPESDVSHKTYLLPSAGSSSDDVRKSGPESEPSPADWPWANSMTLAFFGMTILSSFLFGTLVTRKR